MRYQSTTRSRPRQRLDPATVPHHLYQHELSMHPAALCAEPTHARVRWCPARLHQPMTAPRPTAAPSASRSPQSGAVRITYPCGLAPASVAHRAVRFASRLPAGLHQPMKAPRTAGAHSASNVTIISQRNPLSGAAIITSHTPTPPQLLLLSNRGRSERAGLTTLPKVFFDSGDDVRFTQHQSPNNST